MHTRKIVVIYIMNLQTFSVINHVENYLRKLLILLYYNIQ